MAQVTAQMVKELREKTGAGMLDCKKALEQTDGNVEKAIDWLREKGLAAAAKKAGRAATEGLVHAYIHGAGRVGVLLEVNCETDFVAKNEEFQAFVHEVALQIAAMRPRFVRREDVPEEEIAKEREVLRAQALNEGKPEHIAEKMVEGRLNNFYKENCLLEQEYVKEKGKTIQDLLTELIAKLGENMSIRRFARFEVGEGLEKEEADLGSDVAELLK